MLVTWSIHQSLQVLACHHPAFCPFDQRLCRNYLWHVCPEESVRPYGRTAAPTPFGQAHGHNSPLSPRSMFSCRTSSFQFLRRHALTHTNSCGLCSEHVYQKWRTDHCSFSHNLYLYQKLLKCIQYGRALKVHLLHRIAHNCFLALILN
jgi:hypothetical protein